MLWKYLLDKVPATFSEKAFDMFGLWPTCQATSAFQYTTHSAAEGAYRLLTISA